jgi:DNA polymerase
MGNRERGTGNREPRTGDREETGAVLLVIAGEVASCGACDLAPGRNRVVPGEGCGNPLVMVVGDGPGADEDALGRPFVGRAGQLLDKMLASIGLYREKNCFIANVVKCRPPENRDPRPEEAAACLPFLHRQMAALRPRVILAAGRVAAHYLLGTEEPIGRIRGKFFPLPVPGLGQVPLIAIYHPSALLRSESLKIPAFDDLKTLMARLLFLDEEYREEMQSLAERYAAKDPRFAALLRGDGP